MDNEKILVAINFLKELEADTQIPKNIKLRLGQTIKTLEQNSEISIKVSRALSELEDLTEDANMQPFTRTQLFNIVSMLEMASS
ncbi:MAG: UPF0147 family protein [Candidatus Aenigmarchaeota archaeon]|nr:UPF0147 family protein [Candidatus Aenigmarchaeota archaeon]